MGALFLSLFLLVDPGSRSADISGGVATELRGGWAPVFPGQPQAASMLLLVQPNIDLRIRDRRRGVFLIGGSPRLLMRVPNPLQLNRPLFLGTMHASYTIALTRRWDFGVRAYSVVGELDYTSNALILGPVQGQPLGADVTKYAVVDGAVPITGRVSRRHTLNITPSVGYRTPFGGSVDPIVTPDGREIQPLPQFITGNVAVGDRFTATEVDTIETTARGGLVDFDPGALFGEAEARLGWDRIVRPRLITHIDAGVLTAQIIDTQDDRSGASSRTLPVGTAAIFGELLQRADVRLDGTIGVAVIGYFDPVLARVEPRAGGSGQLALRLPPHWRIGLRGTVYTSANRRPRVDPGAMPGQPVIPPDETIVTFDAPITYRIDDSLAAEIGMIVTARGPHFAADRFELRNTEVWGYVAFRFSMGTARGRREVERRDGPIGTGVQQLGIGAGGVNTDRLTRRTGVNAAGTAAGGEARRGRRDEEQEPGQLRDIRNRRGRNAEREPALEDTAAPGDDTPPSLVTPPADPGPSTDEPAVPMDPTPGEPTPEEPTDAPPTEPTPSEPVAPTEPPTTDAPPPPP